MFIRRKKLKLLKSENKIISKENEFLQEELKEERNKKRMYQKDLVKLLEIQIKQQEKIKDLNNNIEILSYNLTPKKRELININ